MKWILPSLALLVLIGCRSVPPPSEKPKVRSEVPVVQEEQRTVTFTGRLIKLGDETRFRMIMWVGTFQDVEGKTEKFIIGKAKHPFLKHIGLNTNQKILAAKDFAHLPVFRITGVDRKHPQLLWMTSWKEVEE